MATVAAAAAADRRVPKAPPSSKTARHGRTNKPQNRTEKLPNVPSETLVELRDTRELMTDTRGLLPLLLLLLLLLLRQPARQAQAVGGCAQKLPDVTSETHRH